MTDTDIYDKAVDILAMWRAMRPGKKFFGMSADEFAETIEASGAARKEHDQLSVQVSDVLTRRDKADVITRRAVLRVINGVKGDPEEGEDSEVLAAMGYLPHTARTSIVSAARRIKNAAKAAEQNGADKEVKS